MTVPAKPTVFALLLCGCSTGQLQPDPVQQYRLENQDKSGFIIEDFYFRESEDEDSDLTILNAKNSSKITLPETRVNSFPDVRIRDDGYVHIYVLADLIRPREAVFVKSGTIAISFYDVKMLVKPVVQDCSAVIKIAEFNKVGFRNEITVDNIDAYDIEAYFIEKNFNIPDMTCKQYKYQSG